MPALTDALRLHRDGASGVLDIADYLLEAVAKQTEFFSCLLGLRPLMQRPENSDLFRCFPAWRVGGYIWHESSGRLGYVICLFFLPRNNQRECGRDQRPDRGDCPR
jgi:hypothetical protein